MSAYIVTENHIEYLIEAALSRRILGRHGSPLFSNDQASRVGQMLWEENAKSVAYRYSEDAEPVQFTYRGAVFDGFDPVQILASCDCYEYQSCEHDEWESSEACKFITKLRRLAWHALDGYDDAEWGAPETTAERCARVRREMDAAKASQTT